MCTVSRFPPDLGACGAHGKAAHVVHFLRKQLVASVGPRHLAICSIQTLCCADWKLQGDALGEGGCEGERVRVRMARETGRSTESGRNRDAGSDNYGNDVRDEHSKQYMATRNGR